MLSHEHGRVAVVGLPRDVDARPRACGHGARLCIHPAGRYRSASRRDHYPLPTMLAQVAHRRATPASPRDTRCCAATACLDRHAPSVA